MTSPRTCRCGHTREHPMVSVEADHGILGYVMLIIGGTPTPTRVRFRCRTCGQVFDETTDLEERRKHK